MSKFCSVAVNKLIMTPALSVTIAFFKLNCGHWYSYFSARWSGRSGLSISASGVRLDIVPRWARDHEMLFGWRIDRHKFRWWRRFLQVSEWPDRETERVHQRILFDQLCQTRPRPGLDWKQSLMESENHKRPEIRYRAAERPVSSIAQLWTSLDRIRLFHHQSEFFQI